jgi:tRNA pseudouridine13 synthase
MKLKVRPEDFRVEEHLRLRLKRAGAYSVYRLEKRLWNTLDVVRDLETRHGLRRVSRAGLKDRYSLSVQYLSVPGRGPRQIVEKNYSIRQVGMTDEPVSREVLVGNSFHVTLRALSQEEVSAVERGLPLARRLGFANYYDEQRLGSARAGQGFIARKLVDGHYNGALKLWLATPSSADDSRTRKVKALLARNWGDWARCLEFAPGEARPALAHLARKPRDFRHAAHLIPRPLLEIFIGAYQAWLWNEILLAVLDDLDVKLRRLEYSFGTLGFFGELTPSEDRYLRRLAISAPGPDAEFPGERVERATNQVLSREGLTLKKLEPQIRIRGVFFKAYKRDALVVPQRLESGPVEPDELYPGTSRLTLSFFLPAGSFATVLVKHLSLS